MLPDGQDNLDNTLQKSITVKENTSPTGKQLINKNLDDISRGYRSLSADVEEAKEAMELCLREWRDYEQSYKDLVGWLEEMEDKMKNDVPLVDNLEEKSDQLQEYQVKLLPSANEMA